MDEATKKRLAVAGTEYQRLSTGRHHVRVSGVIKEQTRGKDGLSSSTHWVQKAPVLLCDRCATILK